MTKDKKDKYANEQQQQREEKKKQNQVNTTAQEMISFTSQLKSSTAAQLLDRALLGDLACRKEGAVYLLRLPFSHFNANVASFLVVSLLIVSLSTSPSAPCLLGLGSCRRRRKKRGETNHKSLVYVAETHTPQLSKE